MTTSVAPVTTVQPIVPWTAEIEPDGRVGFKVMGYFRAAVRDAEGDVVAYVPEDRADLAETTHLLTAAPRLYAAAQLAETLLTLVLATPDQHVPDAELGDEETCVHCEMEYVQDLLRAGIQAAEGRP